MRFFGSSDSRENPAVVTPWHIMHFVSGIAWVSAAQNILNYSKERSIATGSFLHVCYELQDSLASYTDMFYPQALTDNSFINSLSDQLTFEVGMRVAEHKWNLRDAVGVAALGVLLLSSPIFKSPGGQRFWTWNIWSNRG